MAERLDRYLVAHGLAKSRERAKELIKSGSVMINGVPAQRASAEVSDGDTVTSGEDMKYVGRGALKLIKALDEFGIDIQSCVCADIGASTGGFTQVMLERGAKRVFAVDVGHGQLDESLLCDDRVVNMEGTNVKDLTRSSFDNTIEFMSVDLSFISLANVATVLSEILSGDGTAVVLIKPQFEVGRAALNKKGIANDPGEHIRILGELCEVLAAERLYINALTFSPIRGGSGNIEYLSLLKRTPAAVPVDHRTVVMNAFSELRK